MQHQKVDEDIHIEALAAMSSNEHILLLLIFFFVLKMDNRKELKRKKEEKEKERSPLSSIKCEDNAATSFIHSFN